VLIVGGRRTRPMRRVIATYRPDLRLTLAQASEDPSEVHVRLTLRGPFDLVVDVADLDGPEQARLFHQVFMHLRRGGVYLARQVVPSSTVAPEPAAIPSQEDGTTTDLGDAGHLPNEDVPFDQPIHTDLWSMLSDAQDARLRNFEDHRGIGVPFRDVEGLGGHLARLEVHSKMLRIVNDRTASPKIRETEIDRILAKRPGMGELLDTRDALTWTPDLDYRLNLPSDPYLPASFDCTALALRRYDEPTCSRGQVVVSRNLLLPATFRHHWMERMVNIYVVEKAPRFGVVRRDLSNAEPLPGSWFHFDSEWPGHFGHLLTEQISRLWAWQRVRELDPEVKLLTTLQHDRVPQELLPFEVDVLAAFGVGPEDVHVYTEPCIPERLYTATPMFSLPHYVHPEMVDLWDQVGDHLAQSATTADWPRLLFVSRRPSMKRACHNAQEVEAWFAARGFEVVYPEDHPLADQVAMFRAAETVAGFAGSGLFHLAFVKQPTTVITLAPYSYTARNEHLIAATRGHRVVSVWSTPDIPHPAGTWTQEAFGSSFTFDFEDEGRYLAERLDELGHHHA
jgi:capsular polysaccharide biosynthesis protein